MAGMVTSIGIGGPWQSGEDNDNSRRLKNMKSKKRPASKNKKRYPKKK